MFKRHRSFVKALSFLCVLSLILSIIPPVGIWQSVKANDTTLYNGGYNSYNGQNRSYWLQQADKSGNILPSKNIKGKDLYFNCEIYAERRQIVYGEPWDVPENQEYGNFKADPNGYFLKDKTSGTRGWFRYLGYSISGAPFSDSKFPWDFTPEHITRDRLVPWASLTSEQKHDLGVSGYNPSVYSNKSWETISENLANLREEYENQPLSQLLHSISDLKTYGVFLGVDEKGSGAVKIIWKDSKGRLRYRTYVGMILQKGNPKVKTDSVTGSIDSYSYLTVVSGSSSDINNAVLRYDPATNQPPNINVHIIGSLEDKLGSNGTDPYYDKLTLTRNDVIQYQTVINYVKINGQNVTGSVIGKYVQATPTKKERDEVIFKTPEPGVTVALPPSMLKPGDNTVTISGKARVVFNTGEGQKGIDAGNSKSISFTIRVKPSLQQPSLQLSVVPAQSTVTVRTDDKGNLVYTPDSITHTVKPARVSNITVPAGFKVKKLEFVIDKDNSRVSNATTIIKTN
ncbi:PKD domain-containing protein [Caldicellulosiruptor owensensis OL]|uniref:PKD domain-containing protein n=1 Tax=Caldicellulosiruptor owensensis (strain ATCC 700167 / DSM 13100 / OL) TaxID=632518 RepID=E4Q4H1_CALOW|nr:hypothetical protein [Caldicellulosiruptor owensensis]ADQ05250.1 PKD domain-containing protein [Caldicellulosiruptor owensensis OL]